MPYPKITIEVDWNHDGGFGDANEDITSNVLEVSIERGRDSPWGRANAGQCQMTLRNDTNLYTPSNGSGALSGNLIPGRKVRVHFRYPWDSFTETGSSYTELDAHTADKPTDAGSWVEHNGTWRIDQSGDYLYLGATSATIDHATMQFGTADGWVAVDFTRRNGVTNAGLVLRADGSGNYILIHHDCSNLKASKVASNSVDSVLATSASFTWTADATKRIRCRLKGEEIWAIVEDTDGNNGKILLDFTSDWQENSTRHGVATTSHTTSGSRFDNFGGDYPMFTGFVDEIKPSVRRAGQVQTATLFCSDLMTRLSRTKLHADLSATNATQPTTAGVCIAEILSEIAADSDEQRLEVGFGLTKTICSAWGDNALELCYDVQESTVGFFYIDSDGWPTYEGWDHRFQKSHTTSLASVENSFLYVDYSEGLHQVLNEVSVTVSPTDNIGTLAAPLLHTTNFTENFFPGQARQYFFKNKDYFSYDVNPAIVITANTLSAGSGTNISSDFGSTVNAVTGEGCVVTITNNGSIPGWVTKITVTDDSTGSFLVHDPVTRRGADATSKTAHGLRNMSIDSRLLRWCDTAQMVADAYVARYKDPRKTLRLGLVNRDQDWLNYILAYTISDRVTIDVDDYDIDEDFFIEGVQYELHADSGGLAINTRWIVVSVGPAAAEYDVYLSNQARNADFEHWVDGNSTDPAETGVTIRWLRDNNSELAVARSTTKHGGTYAAQYTPTNADPHYAYLDLTAELLPFVRGRSFTGSAWVKLTTGRDDNVHVTVRTVEGGTGDTSSSDKAADTDWEQLSTSGAGAANNDRIIWLMVEINDGTSGNHQAFYVDDASFTIDAEDYV